MAIDSDLQSPEDRRFVSDVQQMVEGKPLSIQGLDKLNFLVGRAYCSDQDKDGMCENRDGSERAVSHIPSRRRLSLCPLVRQQQS